ncbi:MAG: sigma-70 family RNA polymerase sigma factor [Spirochaetes bacterium]|nr:sigma-70 family RNA polymerase sigma factor [Spirochaetota bacterium]
MTDRTDAAFTRLTGKYGPMVFRVAANYLGNDDDAKDVMQEVFIKFSRRFPDADPEAAYSSLFYRMTINASCDHWRKNRKRRHEPIDEAAPADTESPEAAETRREVQSAIASLPEQYRAPVILRYMEGRSSKEISEVMRISVSALDVRLFRAREILSEKLSHILTAGGAL